MHIKEPIVLLLTIGKLKVEESEDWHFCEWWYCKNNESKVHAKRIEYPPEENRIKFVRKGRNQLEQNLSENKVEKHFFDTAEELGIDVDIHHLVPVGAKSNYEELVHNAELAGYDVNGKGNLVVLPRLAMLRCPKNQKVYVENNCYFSGSCPAEESENDEGSKNDECHNRWKRVVETDRQVHIGAHDLGNLNKRREDSLEQYEKEGHADGASGMLQSVLPHSQFLSTVFDYAHERQYAYGVTGSRENYALYVARRLAMTEKVSRRLCLRDREFTSIPQSQILKDRLQLDADFIKLNLEKWVVIIPSFKNSKKQVVPSDADINGVLLEKRQAGLLGSMKAIWTNVRKDLARFNQGKE